MDNLTVVFEKNEPVSVSSEMIGEDVVICLRGLLLANKHLNENEIIDIPLGYSSHIHAYMGINPMVDNQGDEVFRICSHYETLVNKENAIKVAKDLYVALLGYRHHKNNC